MKTFTRSSLKAGLRVGLPLLLLCALAAPGLAQQCVQFQGIDHCPIGAASLDLTPEGLHLVKVGGAGVAGGVASLLPPQTTNWSAELDLPQGPAPWTLFSAVADGAPVARLRFDDVDNGYLTSVAFSGASAQSTFSVLVFDDGVLQGAVGGVPSDQQLLQTTMPGDDVPDPWDIVIIDWPGPWGPGPTFPDPWPDDDDGPIGGFGILAQNGACFFTISNGLDMLVRLPGGQVVTGDEIEFREEVAQGHSFYQNFQAMETVIGGPEMTIINELSNGI